MLNGPSYADGYSIPDNVEYIAENDFMGNYDRYTIDKDAYGDFQHCPIQPGDSTYLEANPNGHIGTMHFPPNAYCNYQWDLNYQVNSDESEWLTNYPAFIINNSDPPQTYKP